VVPEPLSFDEPLGEIRVHPDGRQRRLRQPCRERPSDPAARAGWPWRLSACHVPR
jgi:hypothetical protein